MSDVFSDLHNCFLQIFVVDPVYDVNYRNMHAYSVLNLVQLCFHFTGVFILLEEIRMQVFKLFWGAVANRHPSRKHAFIILTPLNPIV